MMDRVKSLVTVYAFEAKSIQRFVLEGSRLLEMVGASNMLEQAAGAVLNRVLDALGLVPGSDVVFARRGGGAFTLVFSDAERAREFQALWSLVFQRHCPGMEFVHARAEDTDAARAIAKLRPLLERDRNRLEVMHPPPGPLVRRNPRTGQAAQGWDNPPGGGDPVPVENLARRKRRFADNDALAEKFLPPGSDAVWPRYLSPEEGVDKERIFPFIGDERYIGVIHADGNGLGQLIIRLAAAMSERPAEYVTVFAAFSESIAKATEAAAREAGEHVLLPNAVNGVMPARPVLLGGDDLTLIVRADLAVDYTRAFLERFEHHSGLALAGLREAHGLSNLPAHLTACAGVAFIKSRQPFYMACRLAESLCAYAKKIYKQSAGELVQSGLAFHRVTTSMIDDYDYIREHGLTVRDRDERLVTGMQPYAVGKESAGNAALLDDLLALARRLSEPGMARGATRELLGMLHLNREQTEHRYQRWRNNLRESDKQALADFDVRLGKLLGEVEESLPFGKRGDQSWATPLGDVHMLQAVGART